MALLKSVSSIPIIITACFTINILFCHIWRYLPLWICIFTCVGVKKPVQRLQWSQEQQQQLSTFFCRVSGGEYTCSLIWQYVLKDIFQILLFSWSSFLSTGLSSPSLVIAGIAVHARLSFQFRIFLILCCSEETFLSLMRHSSCLAHFPSLFSTVWPGAVRP